MAKRREMRSHRRLASLPECILQGLRSLPHGTITHMHNRCNLPHKRVPMDPQAAAIPLNASLLGRIRRRGRRPGHTPFPEGLARCTGAGCRPTIAHLARVVSTDY
jgi:hypothetical protein